MPLLATYQPAPLVRVAVWRDAETLATYREHLPDSWLKGLPAHSGRALHTLSARRALLELSPELRTLDLLKDQYGKPQFSGQVDRHFSLTHTAEHGAAVAAFVPCGIDLQVRTTRIESLRSKFERPDERAFIEQHDNQVDSLHVLWGAKEALFKLWGKRQIDWRKHLVVHEFADCKTGSYCEGEIRRTNPPVRARIWYRWIGQFCLVVAYAV